MLNSIDLRANIAVMKIIVKLLIQDYLNIPCKKTINEQCWFVIAAGMLRPISFYFYLITRVLHGS